MYLLPTHHIRRSCQIGMFLGNNTTKHQYSTILCPDLLPLSLLFPGFSSHGLTVLTEINTFKYGRKKEVLQVQACFWGGFGLLHTTK